MQRHNFVFISPHFPANYAAFSERLAEKGQTVLGVADAPYHELSESLRAALTEYYRVDNMEDEEQMAAAISHFIDKHGPIHRLDSQNEHWLEQEARLRERFGITGLRPADMDSVKRKSEMKQHFINAGMKVARGRLVHTPEDLEGFIAEVGYPVVAKPDIGVGAARTYKLESPADLPDFWESKLDTEYIAEEFVDGRIITYDGLIDIDGNIVIETSMEYSRGVMEVVNDGGDIYFYVVRDVPADLSEAGHRVAAEFGVRERYFHFEFFRMPDGSLTALEVNMRVPGGVAADVINYAHDIDMYAEWANLMIEGGVHTQPSGRNYCTYVSRRHEVTYALGPEEIRARYGDLIAHQADNSAAIAAVMGDTSYLLRHPDLDTLKAAAEDIHRRA